MRPLRPLLPLVLLAQACAPADPHALTDQGARALGAGDTKAARDSFETALVSLKPDEPDFARASMGRFQALARGEPERARDEFLAYAKLRAEIVGEGDYGMLAAEFLRRERTIEAIDVMDAGIKAFPRSETMLAIRKQVEEQARAAQSPAALQKLRGLGYVGGEK